jgi:hypothetical protein
MEVGRMRGGTLDLGATTTTIIGIQQVGEGETVMRLLLVPGIARITTIAGEVRTIIGRTHTPTLQITGEVIIGTTLAERRIVEKTGTEIGAEIETRDGIGEIEEEIGIATEVETEIAIRTEEEIKIEVVTGIVTKDGKEAEETTKIRRILIKFGKRLTG